MLTKINTTGRATVVEVTTENSFSDERIVGVGRAVCAKDDHYVAKIGERIALARAMRDLADQLEKRWDARVVTKAQLEERKRAKVVNMVAGRATSKKASHVKEVHV